MKKILSLLLTLCMLVSLMPLGAAAYAAELDAPADVPAEAAPVQAPASTPEVTPVPTPEATPVATPAATPELTPAPEASATPAPSSTPEGAEADAPEATPTPTPTPTPSYAAAIGEARFLTLQAAIDSIHNAALTQIALLRDVTAEGIYIPESKLIILDLGGHSLSLAGYTQTPEGGVQPNCLAIADAEVMDAATGEASHLYSTVLIRNGSIYSADSKADNVAICSSGELALENVKLVGGIRHSTLDEKCTLNIRADQFGAAGMVKGAIIADGLENISISAGSFLQDVTPYLADAALTCARGADGLFAVSANSAAAGAADAPEAPALSREAYYIDGTVYSVSVVESDDGAGEAEIKGLKACLSADAIKELIRMSAAAPAAASLAAEDTAQAASDNAADEEAAAPTADVCLFVSAELLSSEDGIASYDIRPYASVDGGAAIEIPNELIYGDMTLSFHMDFEPDVVLHQHEGNEDSYFNSASAQPGERAFTFAPDAAGAGGTVTLSISGFSVFVGKVSSLTSGHASIKEALSAQAAQTLSSLSLQLDADGSSDSATIVIENKTLTLDLNGAQAKYTGAGAMFKLKNSTLKIIDSSGNGGTIDAGAAALVEFDAADTAGSTLIIGDDEGNTVTLINTADVPFKNIGTVNTVKIQSASTPFDPLTYVDERNFNISSGTPYAVTPKNYVAQRVGRTGTVVKYAKLADAISDYTTTDLRIELIADTTEDITLPNSTVSRITIKGGGLPNAERHKLTGSITVTPADSTTPEITLENFEVDGNVTMNDAASGKTGALSMKDMAVSGAITTGNMISSTLNKVSAASFTHGGDTLASGTTATTNITLADCTITTVSLGGSLNRVELHGLKATDVTTGDNITSVTVHNGTKITGTLTIGQNNKTVKIDGKSDAITEINSLTVDAGSNVLLGNASANDALRIDAVTSTGGTVTFYNGTFEYTNPTAEQITGIDGAIKLRGGTYAHDYTRFCDCVEDKAHLYSSRGTHYTHYVCEEITGTKPQRYQVAVFVPYIVSPASGMTSLTRAKASALTFKTNIPATHACQNDAASFINLIVDRNEELRASTAPLAASDYTYGTYTDTAGNEYIQVTLSASYLNKLGTGTYYLKVDSSFGTAIRRPPKANGTQGDLAGFKIALASSVSSKSSSGVRTGDEADLPMLSALMLASAVVCGAAYTLIRKRRN